MLGMKSLCPGASISVTTLDSVSNLVMPTSMVTPLRRDADRRAFGKAESVALPKEN